MGMFDYFTIDYPLPIESYIPEKYKSFIYSAINEDGFQTKDLECLLYRYHVDNIGRIFCADFPDFESDEEPVYNKIYQHGHVFISTVVHLDDNGNDFWLEYDLKFTDSLLVSAKMIHPKEERINELHRNI
jgi:hypothetical protein